MLSCALRRSPLGSRTPVHSPRFSLAKRPIAARYRSYSTLSGWGACRCAVAQHARGSRCRGDCFCLGAHVVALSRNMRVVAASRRIIFKAIFQLRGDNSISFLRPTGAKKYSAFRGWGGEWGWGTIFSRKKRVYPPHKSSPIFGNRAFIYSFFRTILSK